VAATQAVFYRDVNGFEHVDEFIETLPAKRAAKIDEYIDEHLNGRPPNEPPPEYPVSSQIEGELRELRVRFANTRYRILYQRSDNLIVLLHVIEKDTGAIPRSDIQLAKRRMTDLQGRMDATRRTPPRAAGNDAPPRAGPAVDVLIDIDKLRTMTAKSKAQPSPAGRPATTAARARAGRSEEYREARDEYAAIRALRQRNWIAAHIRERRYELDLTQQEVAERAGTSHSFISKLEGGDHIPTIPVLKRILSVLDEELLIGIERRGDNSETEREIAPVPELASG
jgi:phage-related protein/ribosome-binding protein aMBF1 (putative translation factor)